MANTMKIVAFGHQKGAGKDTAAQFLTTFLKTNYPKLRVKHTGFANKLKDVSFQLFKWAGLKRAIYYETHYSEKEIVLPLVGLTPREIWIAVGNGMREIHQDVWINCALSVPNVDILIISDLRFKNEAHAIGFKGLLIRIDRDIERGTDPAEIDLLDWTDWDRAIDNNGTLQELNTEIESLGKVLVI